MATSSTPAKDPAGLVIKKHVAKALKERELTNDALYKKVKTDTGHGISKIKKYVNQMVGAEEVEEKPRKARVRRKTTYALTNKGRKQWL